MDPRWSRPVSEETMEEISEVPPILYWTLWVSIFGVVAWGMMLLFSRRPWEFGPRELPEPVSSEPQPERPDEEAKDPDLSDP